MKRKYLSLIFYILIGISFYGCRKDIKDKSTNLKEVFDILQFTEKSFLENAAKVGGNPKVALANAFSDVKSHEFVFEAELVDSTYILIKTKAGFHTSFQFDLKDADGLSVYRGSGNGGQLTRISSGSECSEIIDNKKVLLFAAETAQFYKPGEIEAIVSRINSGSKTYDVVVLKNEQCTPNAVKTFGNYGLVLINTHGNPDGFMSGLKINFSQAEIPKDEASLKAAISQKLGASVLKELLEGKLYWGQMLSVTNQPDWYINKINAAKDYKVFIHSNFLKDVPDLSKSVIMGNMCYSGFSFTRPNSPIVPIRSAFMSRNPISYYCYAFNNNKSSPVGNNFAKEMEDTLIRRLLLDIDSTGISNLKSDNATEFRDIELSQNYGSTYMLYFKQFGSKSHCFGCGSGTITDGRDGKEYKTVCIGNQVWMAENLDYDVEGSMCYDNDISKCQIYGRLYTWDAATQGAAHTVAVPSGVRGVCPVGWHLPSDGEWQDLLTGLGATMQTGGGLVKSTDYWNSPNTGATNSSGLGLLPGGEWEDQFGFRKLGNEGLYWSVSRSNNSSQSFIVHGALHDSEMLGRFSFSGSRVVALGVRCVKD